jgi:hypothetical protein
VNDSHNFTIVDDDPECESVSAVHPTVDVSEVESGTEYRISWDSDADATEYLVEESTNPDFDPSTTTIIDAPTTEAFFVHEVSVDTTYYYRVRGRNTAGACFVVGPANSDPLEVLVTIPLLGIIPAVGSLQGGNDSFFRTGMQLYNPTTELQTGTLRFHPAGVNGTDGDPSMDYSLLAGQTLAFEDIVEELGQTGLGSMDVVPTAGGFPVVITRVFNDNGEEGTTGMFEELMYPADALHPGQTAVLVAPADVLKARMNVGVRTLDDGAVLEISLKTALGTNVKTFTRSYGPNHFIQMQDKQFLDYPMGLLDNDVIVIKVLEGHAIVYGSNTDNLTNDPAIQVGRSIQ